MIPKFIVVDDDDINNIYSRIIIKLVFPKTDIQTYTDPEEALAYIKSNYTKSKASVTVLFLDINMPTLTGWEFLDIFEQFDVGIKEQFKICMLSSSIDPRDKEHAMSNKNVLNYIEKPVTEESIISIVSSLEYPTE